MIKRSCYIVHVESKHIIPAWNPKGDLPPGEHIVTLADIEERFGRSNARRKMLMKGLRDAVENLSAAGVKKIWVNGSFITTKAHPNDIDGCWECSNDVDLDILDSAFLNRSLVKAKYGLDFFIAGLVERGSGKPFSDFFQTNRDGAHKGILVINIGGYHDNK